MSNAEIDERINLNEIRDISEDEFKKQISAWIDERGISRKLQSKLRADLFEQFNRTKLGRQMTEQHQLAHRMVLSPLILVLNTLVAEFLYTEDCHFTLSVFANEVPYKNTLPNFEATPAGQLFQFSQLELNDIFEAIGFSKQNEQTVREFYMNRASNQDALNKSLLYCIMKALISQIDSERAEKVSRKTKSRNKTKATKVKPSTSTAIVPSTSSQQSLDQNSSSPRKNTSSESTRRKYEHLHISSRYFKYLNRYLDILSERINDMSKSLAEKRSSRKTQRKPVDSSSQEESLKKDLRKIIENINKLTKSQRKSERFQSVLNSIERLSASVEKCNGKLEDLLNVASVIPKNSETIEKKTIENKVDHFSSMDYATWLRELKTSEHGRKFIDRLEVSLQKTMEKERENLEKLYEEKTNNYRMLIRLHYKQKYDANKDEHEYVGRLEKENSREKNDSSPNDKFTPDDTERLLAESLATRALEKEQQVDEIVQTAKIRLQQLERESEDLDQSFQAYLRRQQISKQQMSEDASKIWENYSLSKAALAQYDKIDDKHTVRHSSVVDTSLKMDKVLNSTFQDDVDIEEVLKDLNEIKRLKSPTFNKNEAFPKENLLPLKMHGNTMNTNFEIRPVFDYSQRWFDAQAKVNFERLHENIVFPQNGRAILPRNYEIQEKEKGKDIDVERKKEGKIVKERENEKKMERERENEREKPIASTSTFVPVSTFPITSKPVSTANHIEPNLLVKTPIENIMSNGLSKPEKRPEMSAPSLRTNEITNASGTKIKENGIQQVAVKAPDRVESSANSKNGLNLEKNDKIITTDEKREMESSNISLKINGFSKATQLKTNGTEKLPEITVKNGAKPTTLLTTNGYASKLTTFTTIASESDSIEADSEQISLGAERIIKSPDDFWI